MIEIHKIMSHDDWIYASILVFSFIIATFIRKIPQNINISGLIGFIMAIIILRQKIIYSLVLVSFVLASHSFAPKKKLTLIVFLGTFSYLMLVRFAHFFLNIDEVLSHANVVQLIITLRVIGLTFEISDAHFKNYKVFNRHLPEEPNILNEIAYFYHFCGLFTGPYYTYQMLLDSQNPILRENWDPSGEVLWRIQRLLWSVPIFILVNWYCPLDTLRSETIWEVGLLTRLFYAALVFMVFKTRVYSAWSISESICVILGIGIYPTESQPKIVVGPRDLEVFEKLKNDSEAELNSEAIVNLEISEVEFSNGFRDGMKAWNRSVQTWLAIFVHSRMTVMRVEITMLVSALWHGVYAGYFMSFGVAALCVKLETVIFSIFAQNSWFRQIYIHTIRCRGFEMMATGFLLKNFWDVHNFWSSIYYWLVIMSIPAYLYDYFYCFRSGSAGKKRQEEKTD